MSSEEVRRAPLNRERVLRAAIAMADKDGIATLSMRRLAEELGVVPMALYKHVANKDELLDGMVELVVGEIPAPEPGRQWKGAVRERVLASRQALLSHEWVVGVIESRSNAPPVVLRYMDSLAGLFLAGGLSPDLVHHAMHALGSRMWGFTQEMFPTQGAPTDPEEWAALVDTLSAEYPSIVQIASSAAHDAGSVVGGGCDDQFEFEFALDLLLDGIERRHRAGWRSRRE